MKPRPFYCLISGLICASLAVQAQSDSVRLEYKTEDEHISKSEIQRLIRYVTRANVEEKTLIKFGGLPNSASFRQTGRAFSGGLNTELSIERKLTPSFSLLFGFDNQLSGDFYQPFANTLPVPTLPDPPVHLPVANPYWVLNRSIGFSSKAKIAVRYYYSMARRIAKGKSANNFSGTYVALQASRPVLSYTKTRQLEVNTGRDYIISKSAQIWTLNQPTLSLQWGLQQRVGRRGYLDLSAGPDFTVYDESTAYYYYNNSRIAFALRLNAIIGLGW